MILFKTHLHFNETYNQDKFDIFFIVYKTLFYSNILKESEILIQKQDLSSNKKIYIQEISNLAKQVILIAIKRNNSGS